MSESRPFGNSALVRSVGGSAAARLIVMPVSAILGILVARSIIDNYGENSYAQYMLLVGIAALIPFADLGISASIMNAVSGAEDPRTDSHVRDTLITCMRILAGSATVVILVSLVLTVTGAWGILLGSGLMPGNGNTAAGLCLMTFGLAMFVGFGQRILIGLGLNFVTILVAALQTPIVLAVLWVSIELDFALGPFVAVVSYAAILVTGAISLTLANRRVRPVIAEAFRAAWQVRTRRGARVFDTAWPMLVQMVTFPLAMQSGRIILSHVSDVDELAEFSLASQIYMPVLSVSVAATMSLWPVFARARSRGEPTISARRTALLFAAFAVAAVVAMSLAAGFLAELASGGAITLSLWVLIAYSLLIVVRTAQGPLGMFMTDAQGLRFQAWMTTLMLPVNVAVSLVLATRWGAVGPIIGSLVGVLIFQLLANWWYVARAERRTQQMTG